MIDPAGELEAARARVRELESVLEAIRKGQADALVVRRDGQERVLTLKSYDALIESIVDNALGPTILLDDEGRVRSVSPGAAALCPRPPAGLPFGEAYPLFMRLDDDGPRTAAARIELLLDRPEGTETTMLGPGGNRLYLLATARRLRAFDGLFEGTLVQLMDITARKRAEAEARQHRAQLQFQYDLARTITDHAAEALFLVDAKGRILRLNPAACELLGWADHELAGKDFHRMLHPEGCPEGPGQCPFALERLMSLRTFASDAVLFRRDGKRLSVAMSGSPVLKKERCTGAVVVLQDLTARLDLEKALNLAEAKLQQSQKMEAIGQMAGGIAHDFNNLLTAINGYASMLEAETPADDARAESIRIIRQAGERAAQLTQRLLGFSRKQILTLRRLDVNDVVRETSAILRRTLPEIIRHEVFLEAGPCPILADAVYVQQVLINLAINARDAMPDGGLIRIETRRERLAERLAGGRNAVLAKEGEEGPGPGRYIVVTVTDTGKGIPDAVRERLFEPFFTTKPAGKGTGLGLSMVLTIMKQCQGSIRVASEPGNGTCFLLYFPEAPAD